MNLDTLDVNFLETKNYFVFGETTKSLAIIENVKQEGLKTVLYISNIERGFNSGEYIRVVDNNNLDVYFYEGQLYFQNGQTLTINE